MGQGSRPIGSQPLKFVSVTFRISHDTPKSGCNPATSKDIAIAMTALQSLTLRLLPSCVAGQDISAYER
jgi:hypothetical protein